MAIGDLSGITRPPHTKNPLAGFQRASGGMWPGGVVSDNFCPCAAIPDIPEDDDARRRWELWEALAAQLARYKAEKRKMMEAQ